MVEQLRQAGVETVPDGTQDIRDCIQNVLRATNDDTGEMFTQAHGITNEELELLLENLTSTLQHEDPDLVLSIEQAVRMRAHGESLKVITKKLGADANTLVARFNRESAWLLAEHPKLFFELLKDLSDYEDVSVKIPAPCATTIAIESVVIPPARPPSSLNAQRRSDDVTVISPLIHALIRYQRKQGRIDAINDEEEQSDPEDWHRRALCAQTDPEAFFPEKGGSTRDAKKICTGCEVRAECLAYALANDERFGIWGGLSERQRRRLKDKANQVAS